MLIRWHRSAPRPFLTLPLLLLLAVPLRAESTAEEAARAAREAESEARLKKDITFLASDECEGRGPTTAGLNRAADYIANEFKKAGLKPGGVDGTYFQPFTIPGAVLDAPATLSFKGPGGREIVLKQGVHFNPMGYGAAGKLDNAALVFAGYGLSTPSYDDYADIEAEGKIVVIFNDVPRGDRTILGGPGGRGGAYLPAMLAAKVAAAEKHRAAAVLFVHDNLTCADGDDLYDFAFTAVGRRANPAKIPVFHIKRSVLESLLSGREEADLAALQKDIDRDKKPHSFALTGWTASLEVKMKRDVIHLKNVIGILDGNGPLADEIVVVGAHYDHLGYGGAGGSLAALRKPAIHHGADDNGSGTTTVIELARRFAAQKNRQGRKMAFMLFSGEELGLIGSDYYSKNPTLPLPRWWRKSQIVAMLNLDMVGRVQTDPQTKKEILRAEGLGSAREFPELVDDLNKKYGFQLRKVPAVIGYSDHASFYSVKVPCLFYWNGDHPDYHRPSDTSDKINLVGMRRVADLAEDTLTLFATGKRYEWTKAPAGSGRPSTGPTLGIQPGDYTGEIKGVLVKAVVDGRPAAKAGIKADDLIVEIAGKPIKDIGEYQEAMSTQKAGTTIEVGIIRDGKKQTMKVMLD
jgi:hypothetical protein